MAQQDQSRFNKNQPAQKTANPGQHPGQKGAPGTQQKPQQGANPSQPQRDGNSYQKDSRNPGKR